MKSINTWIWAAFALWLSSCSPEAPQYDLIVYGATPAGIITAVTAADHGARVLLVEPMPVVGGMSTSGLNTAENEHIVNDAITGRARDFYIRLGELYYDTAYFQTFGNGRNLDFQPGDPAFFFESKHAQALYETMIEEAGIELITDAHLTATTVKEGRIQELELSNGRQFTARYFVDCSYEGDLMAQAGVPYTYGREPVEQYGESLAGLRLIDDTLSARMVDANGALLPYFNRYDTLVPGSGDKRVMNYNFRPIMTEVDSHHVQRIALSDSTFTNEGRIWEIVLLPFEVSYHTITPPKSSVKNLLVPVCASFSHVAFCTYRLESTWMQAGHAAGLAIVQALEKDVAVQDIDIPALQKELIAEGMVIEADSIKGYDDYDWMKGHRRYGHRYKRMYEAYGIDLEGF